MFTYTNILSAILYFLNGGSNDIIHILKISLMSALKKNNWIHICLFNQLQYIVSAVLYTEKSFFFIYIYIISRGLY